MSDTEGLEKEEIKEFSPDAYLLDYIENILEKNPYLIEQ